MAKDWVKKALEHRGIGQSALTRQLRLHFPTWPDDRSVLNKIVNGKRDVSAEEMLQISKVTGYPLPGITRTLSALPIFKTYSDENPQKQKSELTKAEKTIGMIAVTGKVSANSWLSVDDMDFGYDDIEQVPSLSDYPISAQFALRVDGNCLNKIARSGDILVSVSIAESSEIRPDDLVIVQRSRFSGQMVERTAKRVRQTSTGYELWPESTDPAHQKPIKLDGAAEGETIEIVGRVIWILRKP